MKVLFGVFDWGLGHATRDTPIIERLLRDGHEVHVISTGRALALLRVRFAKRCEFFDVPSLGNPYTRTRFFQIGFALHLPLLLANLIRARRLTAAIIAREKYDRVISDARYDVYDRVENSYLLVHQVRLVSTWPIEQIVERWLAWRHDRYRKLLIPDFPRKSLSGRLSHDLRYMRNDQLVYLGVLSQLQRRTCEKDIDYFISVSGPEPQRTQFERIVLRQAAKLHGKIVIALGKPEVKHTVTRKNMTVYGFLDSKRQGEMMNRAKFVVARSGYTTMMEMCDLRVKRGLLIPTPGQTEQVYLAQLYEQSGWYRQASQYGLDLPAEIAKCHGYSGFPQQWTTTESVDRFMKAVRL